MGKPANLSRSPFPLGSSIVTYARDSGGEEQERSVDQQNETYLAYARAHGLTLARQFSDRARPGSTTVGRSGFDEFIAYMRQHPPSPTGGRAGDGGIAGALLWKINRFARDLQDSQFYKADLRRRGFLLHFLADDIPDAGDATPIFEVLLEWKAQRDLTDISTDAKRGLAALVQMRKPDGSYEGFAPGKPPTCFQRELVAIGYKRSGQPRLVSRWVPDPLTWQRGQQAWAMRAAGASYKSILAKTQLFKTQAGFVTFFSNPIYLGRFEYGSLTLDDFVPALATQEQWDAVQRLRRQSAQRTDSDRHPRRVASRYILSGIIYCAHCGALMKGHRAGQWHCYLCATKERDRAACPSSRLGAKVIETTIMNCLIERIITPANITQAIRAYIADQRPLQLQRAAELKAAQKQMRALKRAIANLLDTAERAPSPSITARLQEREHERAALAERIAFLETLPDRTRIVIPSPAQLDAICQRIHATLRTGSPDQIKPLLRAFLVRVDAEKESGTVTYTVPLSFPDETTPLGGAPTGATPIGVLLIRWHSIRPIRARQAERNAAILAARRAGVILRDLANQYGLSTARIDQLCAELPRQFPGRRSRAH